MGLQCTLVKIVKLLKTFLLVGFLSEKNVFESQNQVCLISRFLGDMIFGQCDQNFESPTWNLRVLNRPKSTDSTVVCCPTCCPATYACISTMKTTANCWKKKRDFQIICCCLRTLGVLTKIPFKLTQSIHVALHKS